MFKYGTAPADTIPGAFYHITSRGNERKAVFGDKERFDKNRGDRAIQDLIIRDVKNGQQAGVGGIPAVFVNGKRLKNRSLQGFQHMIEAELKKQMRQSASGHKGRVK